MKAIILFAVIGTCTMAPITSVAQDPFLEMVKEATKKVIRAVDLMVQRLQNKTIWLQNAQKVMENTLSELKLKEIGEWVEKHRQQYENYYGELQQVKQLIADYKEVKAIVNNQVLIVQEYRQAIKLFKGDNHFSPEELQYMEKVYGGMLDRSMENIETVTTIITSNVLQMKDSERRAAIRKAAEKFTTVLQDLQAFTTSNQKLSLQRAVDLEEIAHIKSYYGIK
jgi:hypothetical protein